MTQASRFTVDTIESVRRKLSALPAKSNQEVSLRQAVNTMAPTIDALLERGYTIPDVAQELARLGVRVQPGSLKAYLGRARRLRSEERVSAETTIGDRSPARRSRR